VTAAASAESGTIAGGLPGVDQPVVVSGLLVVLLASVAFVAWRGFVRR
jgi:tetrahydromethanopterin S-methyltransferase subunit F